MRVSFYPSVYKIFIGDKFYVGCTEQPERRFKDHANVLCRIIKGQSLTPDRAARYKYFERDNLLKNGFRFEIVAVFNRFEAARDFEARLLSLYKNSGKLLNRCYHKGGGRVQTRNLAK